MSETTPDPADVHTGTDRVELTEGEWDQLAEAAENETLGEVAPPRGGELELTVESIVAARVQELTAERDELRKVIEGEPWLADLVAARAELAAANRRCEEEHGPLLRENKTLADELAAANTRCAELEKQINSPSDEMGTFNQCEVHGKCVDENWTDDAGESHAGCLTPVPQHVKERLRLLHKIDRQRKSLRSALDQRDEAESERNAARAELASANARCAELEAKSEAFRGLSESWHRMYEGAEALNADIRQRALALADQWDRDLGKAFNPHGDELRAALTPEGTEADWPFTKERPRHLWEGNWTAPTEEAVSTADDAWRDWASNEYALPVPLPPLDATPLLETAFMAGYRRALEEAADAVKQARETGVITGHTGYPTHPYSEKWLRDRAAGGGTKDGADDE